jgi:dihydroorotase
MLTRREFSRCLLAGGATLLAAKDPAQAAIPQPPAEQNTEDSCDLLIQGGTVVDPGQRLHEVLDVAVKDGKILKVSRNFPVSRAQRVFSAKDKIVTPGLIDMHVHCFDGVSTGINADHYSVNRGVTTVVDAGSTGYAMIGTFVKHIAAPSVTRVFALVEIGPLGTMLIGQSKYMYDLSLGIDPELTAKAALENKPTVVGIKVHLSREFYSNPQEMEPILLTRALQAAEASHLPMMVHTVNAYSPLPEILSRLRKGDVLTHVYNSYPNGVLDSNGKILPQVREARERGIFFDVAEDLRCLSFDVTEKCLQQDFLPDTISTDLNKWTVDTHVFDLPNMVSKFMALGLDLDKAIERVTSKPAQVFNYGLPLGTLRPGNVADIGVFELRDGNFEFVDSRGPNSGPVGKRMGHQKLISTATVCRGELLANQSS